MNSQQNRASQHSSDLTNCSTQQPAATLQRTIITQGPQEAANGGQQEAANRGQQEAANGGKTALQQQSVISELRNSLQHARIQSVQKDQHIAALKHSVLQQTQQIGSLQRQVQALQTMLGKLLRSKECRFRHFQDKPTFKGTQPELKDREMLLSLSAVSLPGSRQEDTYLRSSRVGNLSNSRKSRREELMQCQSIRDVYNLPEYRQG